MRRDAHRSTRRRPIHGWVSACANEWQAGRTATPAGKPARHRAGFFSGSRKTVAWKFLCSAPLAHLNAHNLQSQSDHAQVSSLANASRQTAPSTTCVRTVKSMPATSRWQIHGNMHQKRTASLFNLASWVRRMDQSVSPMDACPWVIFEIQ